jgi:hypothetical protein
MGEEIMVNFNGPTSVDMKLTMNLKDHSPIELTWAKDHAVISMDQALSIIDDGFGLSLELTWAKGSWSISMDQPQLT